MTAGAVLSAGPTTVAATPDLAALASLLAHAFHDDPAITWLFPEVADRRPRLTAFYAAMLRHDYAVAGVIDTIPGPAAVALWQRPERPALPRREQRRLTAAISAALGSGLDRALAYFAEAEQARPLEPHWYLGVLASDPGHRGGGHAAALLRRRLGQADASHTPIYLECSRAANITYYERFGFRLTGAIRAPGAGPTGWPMWREPGKMPAGVLGNEVEARRNC